MISFAEKRG